MFKKGLGCLCALIVLAIIVNLSPRRDPRAPDPGRPLDPVRLPQQQLAEPGPKTIPGIAAVDLHGNLTNKGFILRTLHGADGSMSWICKDETDELEYEASAYGDGPTKIQNIRAQVMHKHGDQPGTSAREFLGYIASLTYTGAKPAEARSWAEAHYADDANMVIGGVRFELKGTDQVRMLIMSPE